MRVATITVTVLLLTCSPATATLLCAGGDSLSVFMPWWEHLPIEYDSVTVGVGGDTSRTWTSFHPSTHIFDMVDCAVDAVAMAAEDELVVGTMNLGTNDALIWGITEEEYVRNASSAMEVISPHFDEVVWIQRFYPGTDGACNEFDNVTCLSQEFVLDEGMADYIEQNVPWGCCHPSEQGGAKLAAAVVEIVPEPTQGLSMLTAVVVVLLIRRRRK